LKDPTSDKGGLTVITLIALLAAGCVLVIIVAGIFLLASSLEDLEVNKVPFEQAQWLRGDERVRGTMVDDLIDSGLLKGMDSREVLEYLGPPLNIDAESTTYEVDIEDIFMDEPERLIMVVFFDGKTGEVKGIRVTD
jgi:hypothetical protein